MQINLGKTYDMTNKDLVFDVKIGPDRELTGETIGLVLYDTNWSNVFDNTNYKEPKVRATRDGWYTVSFDNSLLRAFVLEGKSLENILLLYLSFNFQGGMETDVYIDNMRLVDHDYGTDASDTSADLLANATVVQSSADNATYFYNHKDTNIAFGHESNSSHKFSATAAGSQYLNVRYDLGKSYDMTGKNFVMDHNAVMAKYGSNMKMQGRIPEALSGAMANEMYVANFDTEEQMQQYFADLLATYA